MTKSRNPIFARGKAALQRARATVESRPILLLAALAICSASIYYFSFTRVFNLLELYDQPLLDMAHMSKSDPTHRWDVLASMLALGLLYWWGWRTAQRARGKWAWLIVALGALLCGALLLFIFPYDAADIFDYIMHARISTVYGANPFLETASMFEGDPILPYVAWKGYPSTYGPLWVMVSGVAARLAGDGIIANVLAFKLLSGAFLAASVLVVALLLRRKAPQRALSGALLLAWNPMALYETFGHGHNDMTMVFWVILAVYALANRRFTTGILSLVMGALFKFIPLLFLPAAGLIALREHSGFLRRVRFVIILGILAVLLVVGAYAPFWRGPDTIGIFSRRYLYTTSLPAVVRMLLAPSMGYDQAANIIGPAAAALTLAVALWQGVGAYRDKSWLSFTRATFITMMFYLLVTCAWFQAWYSIWPVGLAAIMEPDLTAGLGIFFGYAALTKPMLFAPWVFWFNPDASGEWRELRLGPAVMSTAWLYVIGLLIASLVRRMRLHRRPT
jgi:hypothetical protein